MVDVSVLTYQLEGCFFPDACNAGNVVRAVAHQSLDVHQPLWGSAVFLEKIILVAQQRFVFTHAGACQQNDGVFADELQAVAVAGGNKA